MKTVQQVLDVKGRDVWCIEPDATVREALGRMAEKDVGALVVTEEDHPVGLIDERDYARKVIMKDRSSPQTLVKEIMSSPVHHVGPTQTVDECMTIMTAKRVRHLPVVEGSKLVGLVSIGDLVKSIITEQQSTIDQLEHYIQGY